MTENGEKVAPTMEFVTAILILGVILTTFFVGYFLRWLITAATGYSLVFTLPLVVRSTGVVLLLLGLGVTGSTFRIRKPRDILASTSVTLLKVIRREPLQNLGARTEPFLPKGVYRWTRNPMYSGVVLFLFGLGVLLTSATILLWGAVVMCYFLVVLIPFEEKELNALFGESYREYKKQVPVLFPTGRRYRVKGR